MDVREQNDFLADFDIGMDHRRSWTQGFLLVNGCRVPPRKISLHRVFNCTFGKGGRWYGRWWQNLPSAARQAIRIGGKATSRKTSPAVTHVSCLRRKAESLVATTFTVVSTGLEGTSNLPST